MIAAAAWKVDLDMSQYEAAVLMPIAQRMDAIGSHAVGPGPGTLERRDPDDVGGDAATPESGATVLTETAESKLKRPPMFRVILLNDDYTPMEFVTHVLEIFFGMDHEKAWRVMMTVHTTGSAPVGIYPRDIAETKSEQVNQYAQENEYPLLSTVEMTD